eukprot:COSAG03_NODE_9634_length_704_cov_1.112397_2_plen_113_part_01
MWHSWRAHRSACCLSCSLLLSTVLSATKQSTAIQFAHRAIGSGQLLAFRGAPPAVLPGTDQLQLLQCYVVLVAGHRARSAAALPRTGRRGRFVTTCEGSKYTHIAFKKMNTRE